MGRRGLAPNLWCDSSSEWNGMESVIQRTSHDDEISAVRAEVDRHKTAVHIGRRAAHDRYIVLLVVPVAPRGVGKGWVAVVYHDAALKVGPRRACAQSDLHWLPHCDEKERVAYPVTDEVWIAHIGALLHHVAALDVRVA